MPKINDKGKPKSAPISTTEWEPSADWRSGKTELTLAGPDNSEKRTVVKAQLFGSLAVYAGTGSHERLYSVNHTPTKLRILSVKTLLDAQHVAEELQSRYCLTLSLSDQNAIHAKMPVKAVEWLKACNRAEKYIPYSE